MHYAEKLPEITTEQLTKIIEHQGITTVLEQIAEVCRRRETQATILRPKFPQLPKASEWRNLGVSVLNLAQISEDLEKANTPN
jgi:hypothetical protein